jgi:predicted nucleic acid-binding protein
MRDMESYLLDTNIVSELRKSRPNEQVLDFVKGHETRRLFISVMTIGELRRGAEKPRLTGPAYSKVLHEWVDEIESTYAQQILPIDLLTARIWGELSSTRSRPIVDTLLAATSIANNLTLVTRNVIDVGDIPLRVLNPWDETTYK